MPPLRKIDIHAHIMPERWEPLHKRFGYGGFIVLEHYREGAARMVRDDGAFFREVQRNAWDPQAIIEDMDRHGVDIMVLCTVPVLFYYWAKPEHTLEWARFVNDHLASVVERFPTRFLALGTVPLQDTTLAIAEMERCVRELKMPGIEIGTNVNGVNLDDRRLFPFYEAAEALGCAVLVHPWNMLGADRLQLYWGEWLIGMPAETALAIHSCICGGVFDRFPRLRMLFAHAGGSFPFILGRIAHGWRARPDLCNVHCVRDPREYAGHFWVDSITHDPRALRFLFEVIGEHRVVMGSDYPFPLGDLEHGRFIEEMDIPSSTKERILWRNALEFLGRDDLLPATQGEGSTEAMVSLH
ncbi:MAG: amidohydrolase family protein [Candidatus Kapabacteria bacterium]|nr:amidohydrolase family protein [Candidatus Kapabacteria bacterium]MCS7302540.1 amidohydrolase family protein [Candidatus Kapabacteria bacterium]MCX7936774.1 amidohydrolase family protein [Chlorobiota bacterium]